MGEGAVGVSEPTDMRYMPSTTPTPAFAEHGAGFAGINGGNPHARIWFCGIEFGDRPDERDSRRESGVAADEHLYARLDNPEHRMKANPDFPSFSAERDTPEWTQYALSPFLQKMARIVLAFREETATDLRGVVGGRLFAPGVGLATQLNLYPMPSNRTGDAGFEERHQRATGFTNRTLYRAWCMVHRFPFLRSLVEKYRPAVLVCSGTSCAPDFRLAFLGAHRAFEQGEVVELRAQDGSTESKKTVTFYDAGDTILVITPFLGQGGLMANAHLEALGHELRRRAEARGLLGAR